MDFKFDNVEEEFRSEVKEFIEKELPWDWRKEDLDAEDEVDSISLEFTQSIIQEIQSHPEWTKTLINEVFICESLEQMADHAKKIAEDVIYTVNAEIIRHQSI